ncbi:hypothetical protein JTB14_014356 [Gonioctena quinquepunctata]|nr:hypothetical protein JTB14_014356 [Gonioctena quinquepunctata]
MPTAPTLKLMKHLTMRGGFEIPEVQQGLEETEDDRGGFLDEEDSDDEPLTVVRERLLAEGYLLPADWSGTN